MKRLGRYILILTVLLSSAAVYGQINVKVGYNVASPMFNEVEGILAAYQPERGEVSKPFGGINFMHGIDLGLRYMWGSTSIELGWSSISKDKSSLAYIAASDSFEDRAYKFGMSGLAVGFDNYFGAFGVGSMLSRSNFIVQREIGNNELSIVDDTNYQLRLHCIWQIQRSDYVSLVLKPYYQFGLGDYDVSLLADDLNISGAISTTESPALFGISLFFYNGRQ